MNERTIEYINIPGNKEKFEKTLSYYYRYKAPKWLKEYYTVEEYFSEAYILLLRDRPETIEKYEPSTLVTLVHMRIMTKAAKNVAIPEETTLTPLLATEINIGATTTQEQALEELEEEKHIRRLYEYLKENEQLPKLNRKDCTYEEWRTYLLVQMAPSPLKAREAICENKQGVCELRGGIQKACPTCKKIRRISVSFTSQKTKNKESFEKNIRNLIKHGVIENE